MGNGRDLIWKREQAFNGWACSTCGWAYPVPRFVIVGVKPTEGAQTAFDAHKGDQHPLNRKATSEDVNEAAVPKG